MRARYETEAEARPEKELKPPLRLFSDVENLEYVKFDFNHYKAA
jgi:hypothetical protein